VVGILNFSFDETDNEHFHHEVKLVDLHTHKVFYDKLAFIYLEMPKFSKPEEELETMFDKWLFVLRNLSSLLERPRALQERVFNRLFEAAEIAKFSRKELSEYWESLKNFRDWYSVMKTQLKKGREEGRKEGLEKGRREMQWMNACKMKEDGMSIEMTARYSGLSEDELRELFL
jgi:predicted transposase/invertase (TIGR01784 family)